MLKICRIRRRGLKILVISVVYWSVLSIRAEAQEPPPACLWVMQQIANGSLAPSDLADIPTTVTCFWELAPQFKGQIIQNALQAQSRLQKSSTTVQSGASTSSNGTTSAVSKPITPLASLATEYGGITSSTSNQTITLQTTLDGVPSAFATHGIVPYCWSPVVNIPNCFGEKDWQLLHRFGFGVTANTSTSSQTVTGTSSQPQGTTQQASLQNASNRAPSFSSAFTKFVIFRGQYQLPEKKGPDGKNTAEKFLAVIQDLRGPDPNNPASIPPNLQPDVWNNYHSWQVCIVSKFTKDIMFKNVAPGKRAKDSLSANATPMFNKYYKQIVGILFNGDAVDCSPSAPEVSTMPNPGNLSKQPPQKTLIGAVEDYMASVSIFEAQLDQIVIAAAAPVLSFEYDYNRPLSQPTTSTLKLIGSKTFGPKICGNKTSEDPPSDTGSGANTPVKRYTATLNLAGNLYNSNPSSVPGAGVFRSLQAGTELDTAFCLHTSNWIGSFLGNSTLGLTYYYQDQVSPSILKVTPGAPVSGISIIGLAPTTTQVFTKKGPINFIQLKYGLGVGKNVKFPIAFSWSNRTDLITHSLWNAQFGVSYDFSSLLGSN
jgi:hypothetical protein